jgi:hypothetical protein
MELTVAERLLLFRVIPPAEGDFLFLRAVRALRESLALSPEEITELSFEQHQVGDGVRYSWNPEKAAGHLREIEITPAVAPYISRSILAANGLQEDHLDFYSRFVIEEQK